MPLGRVGCDGQGTDEGSDLRRAVWQYPRVMRTVSRLLVLATLLVGACESVEPPPPVPTPIVAPVEAPLPPPPPADPLQQYAEAMRHLNGEGVPQDYAKAAALFQEAAAAGIADAEFILGLMHEAGRGVERSDAAAVRWYRRAAQREHREAQFLLGLAYYRGRGVKLDEAESVRWFARAADGGHAGAQYHLAIAFSLGRGIARDDAAALHWLLAAAEQGHPEAQYLAGLAFTNGRGTAKDHAWAARWYGKAAEQGLARAQYMLGFVHALGIGVMLDYIEAYKWLSIATRNGDVEAARLRQALAKRMPPDDVTRAQTVARRWTPGKPAALTDRPTIGFVQYALSKLGHFNGPVDGMLGAQTRTAVADYQGRVGEPANGSINIALLQRLRQELATQAKPK